MKFKIIEFDQDYHTVTDIKYMDFDSLKMAEEWCKENSWSGYSYHVSNNDKDC